MRFAYWTLVLAVIVILLGIFYATPVLAQELMNCNGRLMWGDGTGTCPTQRRARPRPEPAPQPYTQRYFQQPVVVPEPKLTQTETRLEPGTIYISHKNLKLYYAEGPYHATVYPIAVGKQGFSWKGVEKITKIQAWPSWRPPADMRRRKPHLPVYMPGGPSNPLGAKALYLGDTLYRIHGTNDPRSIGTYASSGCIRLHNEHILHLSKKVKIGTTVVVR